MKRHYPTWPRFTVALLVAVALVIVWAFVTTIVMGEFQLNAQRLSDYDTDTLQIGRDGTPVINSIHYANFAIDKVSLRTLDGQPWQGKIDENAGVSLAWPRPSGALLREAVGWGERVVGASDSQRRATSWYLVRPDDPLGPAYFVGYDDESKARVGHIGRDGFHLSPPPREQWFDLPRRRFGYGCDIVTSSGYLSYGIRPSSYASIYEKTPPPEKGVQPWQVFLIDGDRLLVVDMPGRSVRNIYQGPNMLSVAIINEPRPPKPADRTDAAAAAAGGDEAEPVSVIMPNGRTVSVGPFVALVAVRADDRIEIINPGDGTSRKFLLPAELRKKDFAIYLVPGESLLVVTSAGKIDADVRSELTWLAPDGRVTRHESVRLAHYEITMGQDAWMGLVAAPFPLVWLPYIGIVFPDDASREQPDMSYADAVSGTVSRIWAPVLCLIAVTAVLTCLTYWLQRKYHRPATIAWCTFVFLLGVPGYLAYVIEQRRVKFETCPECKKIVPRDRVACAACRTLFPPPKRIGTEIFA